MLWSEISRGPDNKKSLAQAVRMPNFMKNQTLGFISVSSVEGLSKAIQKSLW